ncbi:MAG: hypothetical protein ABI361_01890 [Nitrososphaera sp.]|jgi:hypothetical protein
MNKPIIVALAALAVLSVTVIGNVPIARAQYGVQGNPTSAPTQDQLNECASYTPPIPQQQCNEQAILAHRKVTYAEQNAQSSAKGSGTPYFQSTNFIVFIGVLGAIFGGVAAAFFIKGRGSKPVTT